MKTATSSLEPSDNAEYWQKVDFDSIYIYVYVYKLQYYQYTENTGKVTKYYHREGIVAVWYLLLLQLHMANSSGRINFCFFE